MSPLFKKKRPSSLQKRLEQIESEMGQIDHDVRLLSKFVEKPSRPVDLSKLKTSIPSPGAVAPVPRRTFGAPAMAPSPGSTTLSGLPPAADPPPSRAVERAADAPRMPQSVVKDEGGRVYEERFADYLASSMEMSRPLRQERRIQRNKAILMLVFVVFLLILIVHQFLSILR